MIDMLKLTPMVRVLLTGLAAAIGVLAAVMDSMPIYAQAVIVGASVTLAGIGIIPPHVGTATVVTDATVPSTPSVTLAALQAKAAKYDELHAYFTAPSSAEAGKP